MDEILFQAEDLMALNPAWTDREVACRLEAWLVSVPCCDAMRAETRPDGDVLLEFVRVARDMPSYHVMLH